MDKQQGSSIQKKLSRVRPPRVSVSYDLEIGGAIETRELPFVAAILADLSGPAASRVSLRERRFIDVDWDNFDVVMSTIGPRASFEVENKIAGDGNRIQVDLQFSRLSDFEPEAVVLQVEPLKTLLEERNRGSVDGNRIREIDRKISDQLNAVFHAEAFRKLESAWRGLRYLVSETETGSHIRLRVLNVSRNELWKDLCKAAEVDQSAIFDKLYTEENRTLRGTPFDVILADFAFGVTAGDIELLSRMASIAATAHAPFIAGASPAIFGLDDFSELSYPRTFVERFQGPEYAQWKAFRSSQASKYVGLTLPRVLLRIPYGSQTNPIEGFDFQESPERQEMLWGNSMYALGSCLTRAFAQYGWCAAIRGVEGGGMVEGLPAWTVKTDEGEVARKCPTEIGITARREKELADLGFIPLLHLAGTDRAAFFSMQTCCKPGSYEDQSSIANARLSTQLQYILTTSRFAHYLQSIARDRTGRFSSRSQCETLLNQWIGNYVLPEDDQSATIVAKSRYPLSEARIEVEEVAGKPGIYRAVAFLRPHFQLDELSVSMRVYVDLPLAAPR